MKIYELYFFSPVRREREENTEKLPHCFHHWSRNFFSLFSRFSHSHWVDEYFIAQNNTNCAAIDNKSNNSIWCFIWKLCCARKENEIDFFSLLLLGYTENEAFSSSSWHFVAYAAALNYNIFNPQPRARLVVQSRNSHFLEFPTSMRAYQTCNEFFSLLSFNSALIQNHSSAIWKTFLFFIIVENIHLQRVIQCNIFLLLHNFSTYRHHRRHVPERVQCTVMMFQLFC